MGVTSEHIGVARVAEPGTRGRQSGAPARPRLVTALVCFGIALVGLPTVATATTTLTPPPQAGTVTSYPLPGSDPVRDLASGPDGAVWFTWPDAGSIGRMTTSGDLSTFDGPGITSPQRIIAGGDGALWFTNAGSHSIGRITTSGQVTTLSAPDMPAVGSIAWGPDGALWFTVPFADEVGRITTAGELSVFTGSDIHRPVDIVSGDDGAVWFTNDRSRQSLGRIGTDGSMSSFTDPLTDELYVGSPTYLTVGPDGAIWYSISGLCCEVPIGRVVRFDGSSFQHFPDGRGSFPAVNPTALAFGADDALFYATGFTSLGRLSMDGVRSTVTEIDGANSASILSVVSGSDDRIWFSGSGELYAVQVLGVPMAPTDVVATPALASAVVRWMPPAVPGGADVGYRVTASPGGATCTTTTTSCSLVGLAEGTAHTFEVVATNQVGSSAGAPSAPVTTGLPAFVATPSGSAEVTTAMAPDGRLELFARDPAGGLIHRWQTSPNGPWSDWQWRGVFISGTPTVAPSADGRLEIWATDAAGGLIHSWQLAPNGVWSDWHWTGVFTQGAPTAAAAPDGRLEIFATDPAGGLIHSWQLAPNGVWSDWRWTGVFAQGAPGLGAHDGRLEMFAVDPAGGLVHSWQLTRNGTWSDWHWMGVFVADTPAVAADAAGRLRVYAPGVDGSLVQLLQQQPDGPFVDATGALLDPTLAAVRLRTSPAATLGPEGLEHLVVVEPSGRVLHLQTDPYGTWRARVLDGATIDGAVLVATEADRRIDVLGPDPVGGLIFTQQSDPAADRFDPWQWTGVFVS